MTRDLTTEGPVPGQERIPIVEPGVLSVAPIASKTAAQVVIEHHYLHRRPSISYAYGLLSGGDLVGVVTFGTPPSRHMQISACPTNPSDAIEASRETIVKAG